MDSSQGRAARRAAFALLRLRGEGGLCPCAQVEAMTIEVVGEILSRSDAQEESECPGPRVRILS